jgi:3-oxoacyl-[acyl-carrier-protein] synthase II
VVLHPPTAAHARIMERAGCEAGFVGTGGAVALVVEDSTVARSRGARIYAELVGYGATGDAHHIASPDEHGSGAFKAMEFALRDAELSADSVGYINAHGTSTPQGDKAEVTAVKRLFGAHAHRLSMSSTKSMTGHALGAAGGIESIAAIMAIYEGVLAPTINLDNPDEGFDLDFVPNTARERKVDVSLNNTFGFGGHNVSLVFKRFG